MDIPFTHASGFFLLLHQKRNRSTSEQTNEQMSTHVSNQSQAESESNSHIKREGRDACLVNYHVVQISARFDREKSYEAAPRNYQGALFCR